MKKTLRFFIILISWFMGMIIFKWNPLFYNNLNKPSFALNLSIIKIIFIFIYILISISIYLIKEKTFDYNKTLIINYFSNQIFSFLFFTLESTILGFISVFGILVSSIFLYYESKPNKVSSNLIIPYIIFNLYLCILLLFIFHIN